MHKIRTLYLYLILICLFSCTEDQNIPASFELIQVLIGSTTIALDNTSENIPVDQVITLEFSLDLKESSISDAFLLSSPEEDKNIQVQLSSTNPKRISIRPIGLLENNTVYTLSIFSQLQSSDSQEFKGFSFSFKTIPAQLELLSVVLGDIQADQLSRVQNIDNDLSMRLGFSEAVASDQLREAFSLSSNPTLNFTSINEKTIQINSAAPLNFLQKYELNIDETLKGTQGEPFSGYALTFYTAVDSTFKFPETSDEELLTKVQQQTFKYFWDFAHPNSGLIRERNTSNDLVTIGGSGFGLMAIIVGVERGFISRQEGVDRLELIIDFLGDKAERFHGVWSHWLNGVTGKVIPFSSDDDGGDLVETAFLVQGLLTVRQYLDANNAQEDAIIQKINALWQGVEWDWYTQGGQKVLYWHWSPNFGWQKNLAIRGWNESLIVYVLAAASETHTITQDVYHQGWARSGDIINGNSYFDINLPLGINQGGPLFFSHYSFLGLDPRHLEDQYAEYWSQNVAHSQINHAYCQTNPLNYIAYGEGCWGLTASDNHVGYSAHHPNNDLGVITPTAALSSFPYTPEESLEAMRHFYYLLGDKLWGEYGFYDAFNVTEQWYADSYLAIDQGPIIIMIENYRTGLLWDLFMSAPEVQNGLSKLGFTY